MALFWHKLISPQCLDKLPVKNSVYFVLLALVEWSS